MARGGAANADFDSLIDLIQSTVATDTWAENGGGKAEIRPFPNGVLVDAGGMLRLKTRPTLTAISPPSAAAAPAHRSIEAATAGHGKSSACDTCRCRDWSAKLRGGRRHINGSIRRCSRWPDCSA